MIKDINHYAIENPATVYDEESLTALQLVARLTAKVRECIAVVNEADDYMRTNLTSTLTKLLEDGRVPFGIYPSGDEGGFEDAMRIQNTINKYGYCILAEGEFYLSRPVIVKPGHVIIGRGVGLTTVNVINGDGIVGHADGADTLTLRDFTLRTETGIHTGIKCIGSTAEPFTGMRYSALENVNVEGFGTGVDIRGAWCVNMKHCRLICAETCVFQQGTSHNVTYDHCMFLGIDEARTSTGVHVTSEGGVQNCGTTFISCDFERHNYGIRAYAAVSVNVTNIYAESVNTLFTVDSCHAFSCDGGYAANIKRLCNVNNTNTLDYYKGMKGCISNLFCTVEGSGGLTYLVTAKEGVPFDLRNVTAKPVGDGLYDILYYDRDMSQGYAAGNDYPTVTLTTEPLPIKINGATVTPAQPIPLRERDNVKLIKVDGKRYGTTTFDGTLSVVVQRKTDSGNMNAYKLNIYGTGTGGTDYETGSTPTVGQLIGKTPADFSAAVMTRPDVATITGDTPAVVLELTFAVGEMYAYRREATANE